MNPFGPPVEFPANVNNIYNDNNTEHVTGIIHADWTVVYSWPPDPNPPPQPRTLTFGRPTILQSALFKCRCRPQVAETYPISVKEGEKIEVKACEMVATEADVPAALNRTTCPCRSTPCYEKIVVLTINEDHILVYQHVKNVKYTAEDPNTCLLLVKEVPSTDLELERIVEGMDVARRKGGHAYKTEQS